MLHRGDAATAADIAERALQDGEHVEKLGPNMNFAISALAVLFHTGRYKKGRVYVERALASAQSRGSFGESE